MPTFTTRLRERQCVAEGTIAVQLDKPAGFQFQAGQYVDLLVVTEPVSGLEGNSRTFSVASAPYQETLELVMRMSGSGFKTAVNKIPIGSVFELKGPAGSFRLHDDSSRPAVFLAGGIGLAPFLSILRQARQDRSRHKFYLFYSNRVLSEAAYLEELKRFSHIGTVKLHLIPTLTRTAGPLTDWEGETGRINAAMLRRHLPNNLRSVYYIAGPSQFVSGMISVLTAIDVGESDTRVEDFGEF